MDYDASRKRCINGLTFCITYLHSLFAGLPDRDARWRFRTAGIAA